MTHEERVYETGVWTQAVAVAKKQLLDLIRHPPTYDDSREPLDFDEYIARMRHSQDEALSVVKYAQRKLEEVKADKPRANTIGRPPTGWLLDSIPVPSL